MSDTERNSVDAALASLEARYDELCAELSSVEKRLMALRRAESLCPFCGGSGVRVLRVGMYGEMHRFPCGCGAEAEASPDS
jgi:hypothetical protein